MILLYREGYSSSLAAALLRAIGFPLAADVVGGVEARQADGLPPEPHGDLPRRVSVARA